MSIRPIPEGSTEIQTGLWLHVTIVNTPFGTIHRGELYSEEGYCFYDLNMPENYDEDGNLKPAEERVYAQYSTCPGDDLEFINSTFVSVPVQPGYEIVSTPPNPPVTE